MRNKGWWLLGGLALGAAACAALNRQRAFQEQKARNRKVRVLIVGAGVVGSTYAARLARWGMQVTLLARGHRLQTLRQRGLIVEDMLTGCQSQTMVSVVSSVDPKADYDLVLVAVRYGQTPEALDAVKALADTTPILVLQNNPTGADALAARLGQRRLLMGFPATGGKRTNGLVRSVPLWLIPTIIGESDGADTHRLHQAIAILRRAGLKVEVECRMVPWLQTHAAEIAVLAGVVYRNGGRARQMAHRPEEVALYLEALREVYTILEQNGIPITPATQLTIFRRPLWLQKAFVRTMLWTPWAAQIVDEHLAAAPEEMKALYDYILGLAEQAGMEVPLFASLEKSFPKVV